MSTRIVCVDDNPAVGRCVGYAISCFAKELQEEIELFVAYDGIEGLRLVYTEQPDCVIIDVVMPRMDGYQLARCLRSNPRTANIPLIILTAMTREEGEIMALRSGADSYITKPFQFSLLNAYIRAALRRGKEHSKEDLKGVLRYADIEMDSNARLASRGHNTLSLTSKEFDLLVFFVQHPRQVLSRDTIITQVWGYNYEGESGNIVDVYVGYLRKKLEEYGPRLIHTERGVGFILKELKTGK